MRTKEEIATDIKGKISELNTLIVEALKNDLDVYVHQAFLSKERTITVGISSNIKY